MWPSDTRFRVTPYGLSDRLFHLSFFFVCASCRCTAASHTPETKMNASARPPMVPLVISSSASYNMWMDAWTYVAFFFFLLLFSIGCWRVVRSCVTEAR